MCAVQGMDTHLEYIEQHVELDRLLPSHAMVHLACVGDAMQDGKRPDQDRHLGQVALVRQAKPSFPAAVSLPEKDVVEEVGDEMAKGGDGSQGEDGEGVEERVEADKDAKEDNL